MPAVIDVKPLPNYQLLLCFDTNEQKIYDVKPLLEKGIFCELKDEAMFNTVHIAFNTIAWANDIDICPDSLYEKSQNFSQ